MANNSDVFPRNAVLNKNTNTVHKRKAGDSNLQSECGVTRNINHEYLRSVSIEQALKITPTNKCGRCFRGVGGY